MPKNGNGPQPKYMKEARRAAKRQAKLEKKAARKQQASVGGASGLGG